MDIIKFNTTLKASGKDYFKIVFWNRFIRNPIELSEIIRMLENNVTFTQAADSVLECITDSMDICDAVVMQIDRENDTMHVISESPIFLLLSLLKIFLQQYKNLIIL